MVLAAVSACTAPGPAAGDYLHRINALRTSRGLRPLTADATLAALAQGHSQAMAQARDLFHTGDLAAGVPADWRHLAENVGAGPSTEAVWKGFLGSPPHLANVLGPDLAYVGIGVVDVHGTQWTTHRFMATW